MRSLRRVVEKGGLPDTRVAVDDEHTAPSPPSRPEETIKRLALPASAQQFQRREFPLPCGAIRTACNGVAN